MKVVRPLPLLCIARAPTDITKRDTLLVLLVAMAVVSFPGRGQWWRHRRRRACSCGRHRAPHRPPLLDLPTVPVVRLGLVFEDCHGAVQLVGVVTWKGLRKKARLVFQRRFTPHCWFKEIISRIFVWGVEPSHLSRQHAFFTRPILIQNMAGIGRPRRWLSVYLT